MSVSRIRPFPAGPNTYSLPSLLGKTKEGDKVQQPVYSITGRSNVGGFSEDLQKVRDYLPDFQVNSSSRLLPIYCKETITSKQFLSFAGPKTDAWSWDVRIYRPEGLPEKGTVLQPTAACRHAR